MAQPFATLADDFDRRIDAYTFTNKTNVRLIYICVDEQGNEVRNEIDSLTNVTVTGGGDMGAEWAKPVILAACLIEE